MAVGSGTRVATAVGDAVAADPDADFLTASDTGIVGTALVRDGISAGEGVLRGLLNTAGAGVRVGAGCAVGAGSGCIGSGSSLPQPMTKANPEASRSAADSLRMAVVIDFTHEPIGIVLTSIIIPDTSASRKQREDIYRSRSLPTVLVVTEILGGSMKECLDQGIRCEHRQHPETRIPIRSMAEADQGHRSRCRERPQGLRVCIRSGRSRL